MNASKESAKDALAIFESMAKEIATSWENNRDCCYPPYQEDADIGKLRSFLTNVSKRLPSEAAIAKDKVRKRTKKV